MDWSLFLVLVVVGFTIGSVCGDVMARAWFHAGWRPLPWRGRE